MATLIKRFFSLDTQIPMKRNWDPKMCLRRDFTFYVKRFSLKHILVNLVMRLQFSN